MKTLALTTALILGAAAPALAQSQLAQQLGVDGSYSASQLAILKDHSTQTSNDGRAFFGNFVNNERFSTSNVHNDVAALQFRRHQEESREDE